METFAGFPSSRIFRRPPSLPGSLFITTRADVHEKESNDELVRVDIKISADGGASAGPDKSPVGPKARWLRYSKEVVMGGRSSGTPKRFKIAISPRSSWLQSSIWQIYIDTSSILDNQVYQEVVLCMMRLEDVYGNARYTAWIVSEPCQEDHYAMRVKPEADHLRPGTLHVYRSTWTLLRERLQERIDGRSNRAEKQPGTPPPPGTHRYAKLLRDPNGKTCGAYVMLCMCSMRALRR
ncbi:hypothetical protein AYO21_09530 [Fonsecaea monophora]|uniref:Uncharacterized protein n=1 Tax=Fonsecaea monophora TaxID=254056 RepID=A0A177EWG1_9EURO|nr:hypothetical protein AYO21_09530 [Fonsecaea monophora]OAG36288.1 hypothetical protein AYO21_09530 [Fonsecaea monophora]